VTPDDTTGQHPYLVEHIRDALARDERVGELGVEVTLTPAGVFLTGEVASPQRQEAIAEVVQEVAPDQDIHNQTAVMRYPEPGEAEQLP
jgi:osmotically-inducible protein OsmY